MNNKEYLEKIAKDTRKAGVQKKKFLGLELSPKTLKLAGIGAGVVVLMMIIGAIVGSGNGNKEVDLVEKIYFRTDTLLDAINDYNKLVKSGELRSMGNSLNAVLTETSYSMSTSLVNDFGEKTVGKPTKEQTLTDEVAVNDDLVATLEAGRLNGILDRVYSREFTYQIAMLINLETETYNKTKKDSLKTALTTSMNNLKQLHTQFDDFQAK